tara:strand:+ start:391 stop:783 length:393 start_codon:yes stop_codon:yes gene_type:complete
VFKNNHYKALPACMEVRNTEESGHGLYATVDIPAGSYLGISHVALSVEQENIVKRNYVRTPIGGLINHSETPNCVLLKHPQPERPGQLGLVTHMWSIIPIKKGTELTCFYTDGYEDIIDNFGGPKYMAAL